jgi:endonuclease/exonuclease/phosphatase family metal-dependent hydrolase
MKRLLPLALFCALATVSAEPLRVMSYNVRYPNPNDGADVWEKRRDLFMESLRQTKPDVFGTQELFKIQGDDIVKALPDYKWFGTSRRGNSEDEHMGVFYRADRLKLVEWGQFWLSETPDVAGSQSWNTTLPRMVTWGLFEDAKGGDGKERFYFFNTHFAHRREDEAARVKSAEVIGARLPKIAKAGIPVILTGDFNTPAGGAVHQALLSSTGLRDTRQLAPLKEGPEGTFHGFRGNTGTNRIDWILVSREWKAKRNAAIAFHSGERYPSDHLPVLAEIE